MALTENRIDVHNFVSLQGQQSPPAQTKVINDRAGVDGSEFILTGKKGRPFSLVSFSDAESYSDAVNTFSTYQRLIDGDAVEIIQNGVSGDSNDYRVVVLGVELMDARTIRGASGNVLHSPSQGWLVARWDLIAVPFNP